MDEMCRDNCHENRGDHDSCNFLRSCHRLIHNVYMIHKSPLQI
jgi:hypothetical protein